MSKNDTIVLTEHLDDACADWLAEHATLVRAPLDDAPRLNAALADADALLVRTYTQVDTALLERAPKLRVVGRAGVGLDNIDLAACRARGVAVVHTPDANTQAVVEYVWALIFDAIRPRPPLTEAVEAATFHRYRREQVGRQASDLTVGVLGMGRIGRRVAQVGHAIGCRMLYYDLLTRTELNLPPGEASEGVDRGKLLGEADVLSIHVDGRWDNRGLFDADLLAELNPACLLINTSRGFVVDPAALADWARSVERRGGRAVLDVHEPEPFGDDYPLLGLDNVTLLPHLASRTTTALRNMSWVVRDVVRVLEGEPPRYPA